MNNKIKVIKKGESKIIETPDIIDENLEEENTSNMASTISTWVDELRERRREERETAVEQFCS